jgi:hypothetical protein
MLQDLYYDLGLRAPACQQDQFFAKGQMLRIHVFEPFRIKL